MMELGANGARIFDMAGPRNSQTLAGPTEVRRHLLGPLKGRVKRPRPRHRHVWVGFVGAPVSVVQYVHELNSLDGRFVDDAVVGRHLVKRAVQGAFRTGAVV